MDFSWPQEYLDFQSKVRDFAQNLDTSDLLQRDYKGEFSHDLWKECASFGIQGLAATKEFGGMFEEFSLQRSVLAMEAFGYGCKDVGFSIAMNAHLWVVELTISLFGTTDQKNRFLPKMCNGAWIGAHGLTEANSGSDVYSMETTAKKVDNGYILNGEKCLITLAPLFDVAIVFANLAPEKGKWGVTGFIVTADQPGVIRGKMEHKMGLRTVPIGKITLDNCFVPEENRLGPEFSGLSICNDSLEYDRCCMLAGKLGAMQRQLEENIAFVKQHKRFGQSIGKFQSVSNRIADMQLRIETSKLLLYKMAWLKDQGQSAMLQAAMLKLHLSESFVDSSLDSIRIHGGNGYLTEYEIERDLRDSIGGILYAGTSDIQRNLIASLLGI